MDTVTIVAGGQSFRVSKFILKKHSGYLEHRLRQSCTEKSLDIPGIEADVFSFLVNYFTKGEVNILDKSARFLSAVQIAARTLGVSAFPKDLEKTLKASWTAMDISTVFAVASQIGCNSSMMRTAVEDILRILLGDKEQGSLRESDLSYEILMFVTRLDAFWDNVFLKCKYFYKYENLFDAVVRWIVKNSTSEKNVAALVDSLKIHTVSFKFLTDIVANAVGIPDMKEQLKCVLQKKQDMIIKDLQNSDIQLSFSWYDVKQRDVCLHGLNREKFIWEEAPRFTRSPYDTKNTAVSENYVYAIGDQTLTSSRIKGGAVENDKYPERLEVTYCHAQSSSLFLFGWNRRDHVLYEFNSERRKFLSHGVVPLDSNLVATGYENTLYVLGEDLHLSTRKEQLKVFKYDVKERVFSWLAILKKTWSVPELTDKMEVVEKASNCKSHLVISGEKMHVIVQEMACTNGLELYSYVFEHSSSNCFEIEPSKPSLRALMDGHSVLVGIQCHPRGILMLFQTSLKRDYYVALFDTLNSEVNILGFLPYFSQVQNVTADYILMSSVVKNLSSSAALSNDQILAKKKNPTPGGPIMVSARREDMLDNKKLVFVANTSSQPKKEAPLNLTYLPKHKRENNLFDQADASDESPPFLLTNTSPQPLLNATNLPEHNRENNSFQQSGSNFRPVSGCSYESVPYSVSSRASKQKPISFQKVKQRASLLLQSNTSPQPKEEALLKAKHNRVNSSFDQADASEEVLDQADASEEALDQADASEEASLLLQTNTSPQPKEEALDQADASEEASFLLQTSPQPKEEALLDANTENSSEQKLTSFQKEMQEACLSFQNNTAPQPKEEALWKASNLSEHKRENNSFDQSDSDYQSLSRFSSRFSSLSILSNQYSSTNFHPRYEPAFVPNSTRNDQEIEALRNAAKSSESSSPSLRLH